MMRFTQAQIELARKLKASGLAWTPVVGNYVYDADGVVKPGSPFQDRVYFLLNYDCFMDRVGGAERFQRIMTWLPTWSDARGILHSLGVSNSEVAEALNRSGAILSGDELLTLYEMIHLRLTRPAASSPPAVGEPLASPDA